MDKLKMMANPIKNILERVAAICPAAIQNGQIDFERLKTELAPNLMDGPESYDFTWVGKRGAIAEANKPIRKTLRPAADESKNWDTTENLYIEGDNLEVLKLLQESYLNKVKMIYIDPPYNTGKDFVYKDNFKQSKQDEAEGTGLFDEEGNKLFRNTETNGRFHSDWCSMMYPRLKLARDFLTDDGVIFISIDDNEVTNLRKICDEIFGEDNFVEMFSWVKTSTPPGLSNKSRKTVEYILVYEKNKSNKKYRGELLDGGDQPLLNAGNSSRILTFPKDKVLFKLPDGNYKAGDYDRATLLDDIEIKNSYATKDFRLDGEFKWIQSTLEEEINNGTTFIVKSEKFSIRFLRDNEGGYKAPTNLIKEKYTLPILSKKESGVDTNETASSNLEKLLDGRFFDFPKPVSLIIHLLGFVTEENDIIMDFFSGSATTAHAVMQLNAEDGGKRKFIMVQLPEETDEKSEAYKAGFKNICEIGKERIRRAGDKIMADAGLGGQNLDTGFRVLKLDESNMRDVFYSPAELKQSDLLGAVDNIKPDRTPLDLLFGVMIDWGVPLSLSYTSEKIGNNEVHIVDGGELIACFDNNITDATIRAIADKKPMRAVFRDSSFADVPSKINAGEIFKTLSPDTEIKVI